MTESSATAHTLLVDDERTGLAARWRRLEERFVDAPADTVEEADRLIEDAIAEIRAALDQRRVDLRDRWNAGDEQTTEQLREALHDYRVLLGQLADMPAPAGGPREGSRR